MTNDWKRPKTIPSVTEQIKMPSCGNLHLTLGWEEDGGRLIEVQAVIGRSGTCPCVLLNTTAKLMSMLLQSSEPRFKIVEKFKKQFLPDTKGNQITCGQDKGKGCIETIAERVIKELI